MKSLILTALASLTLAGGAVAQRMEVSENGSREGIIGSSEYFTGTAYVEPLFAANQPFQSNSGAVTFVPGARSNWHTHPPARS